MYVHKQRRQRLNSLCWVEPLLDVEVLKVVVLGLHLHLRVVLDIMVKLTSGDEVMRVINKLLTLKDGGKNYREIDESHVYAYACTLSYRGSRDSQALGTVDKTCAECESTPQSPNKTDKRQRDVLQVFPFCVCGRVTNTLTQGFSD